MARRKKPSNKASRDRRDGTKPRRSHGGIQVERVASQNAWRLVHPRCARERAEDIEEVQQMLAAGELEIARDELRWLLNSCSDFIGAHRLLGELALAEGDLRLARAHFGYAYDIGREAARSAGARSLPYRLKANQSFLESAKALACCLHELNRPRMAVRVLERLLQWDRSDPLKARELLRQWEPPDEA